MRWLKLVFLIFQAEESLKVQALLVQINSSAENSTWGGKIS